MVRDTMKNIIEFYYNISLTTLEEHNSAYYFNITSGNYCFKKFTQNPNIINSIYNLNTYLNNLIPINKIILNKDNNPLTKINDTIYILLLINTSNQINLPTISNLSNINIPQIKELERNNWEILWGNMIDYYETQIGQNEKKYPLIRESFDYFVGLTENAISYLVNTKKETKPNELDKKVISHNSLNSSLYDPTNIIIDHKSRDLSEYIKLSFFKNNQNIFKELDEYFYYNNYSLYGIRVLFARIIYPSFYFKLYDSILNTKIEEKALNNIITKLPEYETYLNNIYLYLRKYYNIPEIEWLKKRDINSRLQL